MNHSTHSNEGSLEPLEAGGPWPFVTRRVFRRADQSLHIWFSRAHRKGLISGSERARWNRAWSWLWAPGELNWWIGVVFMLGAFLFALGCSLSLTPSLVEAFQLSSNQVNTIYFAGSIPFTTAAYLQLYQAANAPEGHDENAVSPARRCFFGWRPTNIGWLSCALQFPGTVLFNLNTFDAMIPGLTWWQQDLEIWAPNIAGSILFLASGYLAFVETCHSHLAWKPRELSWWVTFINLLGCIGFMIAALFAFIPPGGPGETWIAWSVVFTLLGAICFFVGSFLALPEGQAAEAG